MNIIQTNSITKKFGDITAIDNVSIHVREGEIYGFLGLNGAGKTTLIRLLLGMISPWKGSVKLFGQPVVQTSAVWQDIGYLVETPRAYPNLSVRENLEVFFRLRKLKDKKLLDSIIERIYLKPYEHRKARHLSMGNNQRLGLAKALMHNPRLLILDEPINGLDPSGIVEVRESLSDLVKNRGTTIFLSSHILSEIAKLATRIGIVHEGRLIKELDTQELETQIIRKLLVNTVNNPEALKILKRKGYKASLDNRNLIEIQGKMAIQQSEKVATLLVQSGTPPRMLNVYEEDLESYFLRVIGKPS